MVILEPGDVISCGNLDRAHRVNVGDEMEVEFERLGLLRNTVIKAEEELTFSVPQRVRDHAQRFNEAARSRIAEQG